MDNFIKLCKMSECMVVCAYCRRKIRFSRDGEWIEVNPEMVDVAEKEANSVSHGICPSPCYEEAKKEVEAIKAKKKQQEKELEMI